MTSVSKSPRPPIKVTFWNSHGYNNIGSLPEDEEVDIFCAYETWLTSAPTNLQGRREQYLHYWANATKDKSMGRASGGLVVAVRKERLIVEVLDTSNLWIFIKVSSAELNFNCVIGAIYVRPSYDLQVALEILRPSLCEWLDKYANCLFIIGGDFNARVGNEGDVSEEILESTALYCKRQSHDETVNSRGRTLMDFMEEIGFLLLNGRTESDRVGNFTFCAKSGNSTIDLVWANAAAVEDIDDLEVNSIVSLSDHFPVTVRIVGLAAPPVNPRGGTVAPSQAKPRIRWEAEKAPAFRDSLASSNRINLDFNLSTPDVQYDNLREAVLEAAQGAGILRQGATGSSLRPHSNKPWFDRECIDLKKDLALKLKVCRACAFRGPTKIEYLELKKSYRAQIDSKKYSYEKALRDRLECVRNSSDFWSTVKSLRKNLTPHTPVIPLEGWSDFYATIYPPRIPDNTDFIGVLDPLLDLPITTREIEKTLRSLKLNKAPGTDSIPNECLKNLPPIWVEYL